MSKPSLDFFTLLGDFKDNFRAIPLDRIFDEIQVAVQDMPDDLLAGSEFCDLLFAVINVFVSISLLRAKFVGRIFNFSGPPRTNVVDGSEGLFRSLIYSKGRGQILIFHDYFQFCGLFGVHQVCLGVPLDLWRSGHRK